MRGAEFRPRNLIQNPDIQRVLRQRLDLKEMSSAPTLAPEISPVILVHDLTKDPAQHSLSTPTFQAGLGAPAVAGQVGYTELVNPAGSGVLIRLRRVIMSIQGAAVGAGFRWGFITSGNASNANGACIDLVAHLGQFSKAALRFGNQLPVVPTQGWVESFGVPITIEFSDREWVIPPLSIPRGFYMECTVTNQPIACHMSWTEEPLPAPING